MNTLFITIENDTITGVHCALSPDGLKTLYPVANIVTVPENFDGHNGESMTLFNADFTRKKITTTGV